jgi:hypothetical protein
MGIVLDLRRGGIHVDGLFDITDNQFEIRRGGDSCLNNRVASHALKTGSLHADLVLARG